MKRALIFVTLVLTPGTTLHAADAPTLNDPVNAVAPPAGAVGYPSRDANLDALPGFRILMYNTLANHYLTVPTRYRGELTSGLIGPVTLLVTPKNEGFHKP